MSKKGLKRKWTTAAYDLLYQELVNQFGPMEQWATSSRPGRDLDQRYERFCELFAELVGADSAGAVKQQIAYARMTSIPESKSIMMNLVLNKAAAYHAGFIKYSDMPSEEAGGEMRLTVHSGEMKRFAVPVRCIEPQGIEPTTVLVFAGDEADAREEAVEKMADKYLRHQNLKTKWIVTGDPVED